MIFDLLAPPQGQNYNDVARPIYVRTCNSHTKLGWISSNSLGGDTVTNGRSHENILVGYKYVRKSSPQSKKA